MSDTEESNSGRTREWCFTINNYTDADIESVMAMKTKYLVYSEEVGDEGTPHLQGYAYFGDSKTMSSVSKKIKRANLRKAKGDARSNRAYIVGPWKGIDRRTGLPKEKPYNPNYVERGVMPQQGKRTDLDEMREQLKENASMRHVVEVAKSYQSIKMAEIYLKYKEKRRQKKPVIIWYYGSTGTGKTERALAELGDDYYPCPRTGRWFDGYDAHKDILVDDVRHDFMPFSEWLKFMGRAPFQVETKGSTRQMLAERVIFTSPFDPITCLEQVQSLNEDPKQFIDRIDYIVEFSGDSFRTNANARVNTREIKRNEYYNMFIASREA